MVYANDKDSYANEYGVKIYTQPNLQSDISMYLCHGDRVSQAPKPNIESIPKGWEYVEYREVGFGSDNKPVYGWVEKRYLTGNDRLRPIKDNWHVKSYHYYDSFGETTFYTKIKFGADGKAVIKEIDYSFDIETKKEHERVTSERIGQVYIGPGILQFRCGENSCGIAQYNQETQRVGKLVSGLNSVEWEATQEHSNKPMAIKSTSSEYDKYYRCRDPLEPLCKTGRCPTWLEQYHQAKEKKQQKDEKRRRESGSIDKFFKWPWE